VKFFDEKPFIVDADRLSCLNLLGYTLALVLLDELVASLNLLSLLEFSVLSFCKSLMMNFADSISSNALSSCFTSDTQFEHSEELKSQLF